MNTAMIKMLLLGVFALMFATAPVYAKAATADDDEEEALRGKRAKGAGRSAPSGMLPVLCIDRFENKSGVSAPELETVCERLQARLIGCRRFEVIDRARIRAVLREQALAAAGVTEGADADAPKAEEPRWMSGWVLSGSILSCHLNRTIGPVGGVSTASVELDVKVVDGRNGSILMQRFVTGTGTDRHASLADSRPGPSLRDAVEAACRLTVEALREDLCPIRVVGRGEKDVRLNVTETEVEVGDLFDLIETDSTRRLGEKKVGRVRITDTAPNVSWAEPVSDAKGKVVGLDAIDLEESFYIARRVSRAQLMREERRKSKRETRK